MKKLSLLLLVVIMVSTLVVAPVVSASPDKDVEKANAFLGQHFNLGNPDQNFKTMKVKSDELGFTHVKMQQVVNGIPVFGNEYIVHFDKNGNVYSSNGKFDAKAKNYRAKGAFMQAKDAIEIAKKDVGFTAGTSVNREDLITSDLYLYEVNGEYIPVYLVRVNWLHENSLGDWRVFVDAVDGNIVFKYDAIAYGKPGGGGGTITGTPATGTGIGVLGDTKSINLTLSNGTYYLQDTTRAGMNGIYTYTANNGTTLPGTLMTDTDTTWDAAVQKAGVDAHYYAGVVYDYYKNIFARNSLDNSGMALRSTVHYDVNYVNAFWDGTQMVYGDGDNVQSVELSGGLDVIGHEMTHGVDSYEANLTYSMQSGALSESLSDTFGTAIEWHAQPTKFDWLVGEDIWTPGTPNDALRSMEDPTIYGDPDHMSKYVYTILDNGGVHTNSGIPNKAAYLVGSNIGVDKMEKIYYRALTMYMISSTNFSQARANLLQSAADLYGAGSVEYNAVASAFDAVGVY